METNRCEFYARFLLFHNERFEVEVWSHEFIPMGVLSRTGAEWAREHLQEIDQKYLREMLGVAAAGDLQVLAKGIIRGYGPDYNGEWDEGVEFEDVKSEPMTEKFVADYLGHERENIPGPEPKNQLERPISMLIEKLARMPYGTTYQTTFEEPRFYGGQTKCEDGSYLGSSYEIRVDIVEGIVPDASR